VKTARAQMILGCLSKALQPHSDGLTDGQLLGQFVARRDEAAFATLVRRHGPMVFSVCRRILRNAHDAEDAFQATFLVLARKASRLRDREAVGSWLYGVAYRAALGARASGLRRKTKEQQVETMPHSLVVPHEGQSELLAVLDQELARLPEKYRLPVVLCELEGRSRKEAARQLGLPEGTLSSRLATARKTLAKRMAGHGPAVTGASLTALFASEAGAAVVPGPLVISTVRAAGGVVSAGVVALAEGVLKAMLLTKIKGAALVLLLAASVGVGTATLTYRTTAAEPAHKAAQPLQPASSDYGQRPVAFLHGNQTITREQLGEYLIARFGAEKLPLLINQIIIEEACRQKNIEVTSAEIEASLAQDLKGLGGVTQADFVTRILKEHGKTLYEWKEDVIRPKLLLGKLVHDRVKVTDEEVQAAYNANYGEKMDCRIIFWPKGEEQLAKDAYASIRDNEDEFKRRAAMQANSQLAANGGRIPLFGHHAIGNDEMEKAAFRLQPGEISPVVDTENGWVVIRCDKRVPPDAIVSFESVRSKLLQDVFDRKVQLEIPKAFAELQKQANVNTLLVDPNRKDDSPDALATKETAGPSQRASADLLTEVEAAAKKLERDPKNKEALDALDQAVKQLKSLKELKPAADAKPRR
jgi:RNA polymerase sigma factor (sigma-70 family)